MDYINYLVKWIKDQVEAAGAKGVVVGISGGVDSAVVAALAKKAFPDTTQGLIMPVGDMLDVKDARAVAESLSVDAKELDLTEAFETMKNIVDVSNKLAIANIKPRLRMTAIYSVAQDNNYLVLGTDNAAELLLGYFTKYGDGGVDLLPIANLRKEQVFAMAKELGLPEIVISKAPSAGLYENQTDESEMGVTYKHIDAYLRGEEIPVDSKNIIENLAKKNQHKLVEVPRPDLAP